jgi:hypothetical protein
LQGHVNLPAAALLGLYIVALIRGWWQRRQRCDVTDSWSRYTSSGWGASVGGDWGSPQGDYTVVTWDEVRKDPLWDVVTCVSCGQEAGVYERDWDGSPIGLNCMSDAIEEGRT